MSSLAGLAQLAIPATTPLLLACMGGIISERSGVLNLGIEGLMAVGALTAIIFAITFESLLLAVVAAVAVSAVTSVIFAFLTISLKADQIVSGVMVALFGVAIANFFGNDWTGQTIETFSQTTIPIVGGYLVSIPYVGELLFYNTAMDYLAIFLAVFIWYILFRTKIGLKITAVGNNAKAADTEGIDPIATRYLAVLASGILAGLAGAALSLSFTGYWTANLVDSRGWVAVALIIVSRWDPLKAIIGSFVFGFIYSIQFGLQGIAIENLPLSSSLSEVYAVLLDPIIVSTYPFVVTILVLILFNIGTRTELVAPQELTNTYIREGE